MQNYVQILCTSYIDKIVAHHGWNKEPHSNLPIPIQTDPKYQSELKLMEGPTNVTEAKECEKQIGFSYC